eukprot:XP_001691062.1 predicted protein [Chlamydomonas reinhardtii]
MGGALGAAGVMMPPPPPVMMQTAMQGGLVQPTGWPPQARFDPLAAQHAAQAGGQAGGVGPSGVGQQADDGATITALTQAMQGLTTGGRVMQPDWQRLGGPVDDGRRHGCVWVVPLPEEHSMIENWASIDQGRQAGAEVDVVDNESE